MSTGFMKKWGKQPEGLKGALRPSKPLKTQINKATNRVEHQLARINSYIDQYTTRDKKIFEKLVHAYERHDNARVNMYANELAEIRKQKNILMHSRLSLDTVALRLHTLFEFGNFVSVLDSAVGTIQDVRTGISGIMPEVGKELFQVETMLSDTMVEMGQSAGVTLDFEATGEESEKIIKEAALIAESRMKTKFPELPSNVSQGGFLVIKKDSDTKEQ